MTYDTGITLDGSSESFKFRTVGYSFLDDSTVLLLIIASELTFIKASLEELYKR